jgi:hypothetical protein
VELSEALCWVAFWLTVCVFVVCEHLQYTAGHNTFLWGYKTPEEKRIQEAIITKLEAEAKSVGK